MGTLYFVLKNTAITFVLVSLLQIKIGSLSLETRLMNLIRSDLAPMFLDKSEIEINGRPLEFTQDQINSIKEKIKNSDALKNARSGAKELLVEEIQNIFKQEQEKKESDEKD